MIKKYISIAIVLLFVVTGDVYAFWINTHSKICQETTIVKKIMLDSELKNIGLQQGVNEKINRNSADYWINEVGCEKEDDAPRYKNHFYNPLDGSGLDDVFTGFSSYEWADQIYSGWSWRNSRQSFYLGLTAPSDSERRSALADSFRALGQVMHLIQDTAVPAHVRNDLHMIPDGFEAYASKNVDSLHFAPIAFSGPKNSISTYSPRQLWDSDQYDGSNPSTSTAIGLAEYTNANFASEDTIFTENNLTDWNPLNNKHYFPFPRQEDTVVFAESQNRTLNGFAVYRKYFEKVGGGQAIKHFATASRLYPYLLDDPEPSIQGFDNQCYKDYADLLIPRAVGYSAALLDYFFRGQIDMVADAGKYVIKNESAEAMSGAFRLYYDDTSGTRKLVSAADWSLSIAAKGASSPVTFTAPDNAKEPGKYMLVFLGTHGAESGAVVGKSIELKNDLDIRIVTVSNYVSQWEDHRGEIKVFTNKGVITGKIPKEMSYQVIKVRFDVSNPNVIGILVRVYDEDHFFRIYRYKIDENNNSLIHEKTVFEQIAEVSEESSILFDEKEEKYGPTEKLISRWTIDWRSYIRYKVIDFYLDGEEIKPFYSVDTDNSEKLHLIQYYCYGNDLNCNDDDPYRYSNYGYRKYSTEIFYGSDKIANADNICSGGGLQANGSYRGCTEEYNVYISVKPMAIFNKNNFSYFTTQHIGSNWKDLSSITTSIPFDLSKYIINPSYLSSDLARGEISLNSHLSKGNSYSFQLIQKWTGAISFSTSLGVLDCGGILVTDRQLDGGYVALKGFDFGVLKSCGDFKKINAPSYRINAQEVSDFYVK